MEIKDIAKRSLKPSVDETGVLLTVTRLRIMGRAMRQNC